MAQKPHRAGGPHQRKPPDGPGPKRRGRQELDVSPADLSGYTLHGDFYTASTLTEGRWRVTFPLVDTP